MLAVIVLPILIFGWIIYQNSKRKRWKERQDLLSKGLPDKSITVLDPAKEDKTKHRR